MAYPGREAKVIEYRPCGKTRNEVTMARLRAMAASSSSVRLADQIQKYADRIAEAMEALHGAPCHVRIGDDFSFILLIRDLSGGNA